MKFTKFGKTLLMSALSAGIILSVASCSQSYTVGYLYVTGTITAGTGNNGRISGYGINHNNGNLTAISGMPVGSGGANPVRAVLLSGSRYLYVLNRGMTASGSATCTTSDPCLNANITQFAVGGNGVLTAQETFYTQGSNPFRIIADSTGSYIYVLDHDAPSSTACETAFKTATCGDITAFKVDSSTGRLSTVLNAVVTVSGGSNLAYFPVPANPVDFVLSSTYIFTLSSATAQTTYPYTGGSIAFPYYYTSTTGQLTVTSSGQQTLTDSNSTSSVPVGTAIVAGGTCESGNNTIYVLDNNPVTVSSVTYPSQILPYCIGTSGALTSQTGGAVPDDVSQANPIYLLVESLGKYAYVANQANTSTAEAESGLAGWDIDPTTKELTPEISTWGSGAGPVCLVEDTSDQFLYTANSYDSTITGRVLDQVSGELKAMSGGGQYTLTGPPTWCLVDGRTN
jgi:6-phosphogluconolactonase (cycloisomerase 2 family)